MSDSEDHERADRLEVEDPRKAGVLREISTGKAYAYKEHFGRGPETVRTRFSGPDAIVSTLGNSLTPVEIRMPDIGEEQRLRDICTKFQHATEAQFRDVVTRVPGRTVVGFMSGIDIRNDLSV